MPGATVVAPGPADRILRLVDIRPRWNCRPAGWRKSGLAQTWLMRWSSRGNEWQGPAYRHRRFGSRQGTRSRDRRRDLGRTRRPGPAGNFGGSQAGRQFICGLPGRSRDVSQTRAVPDKSGSPRRGNADPPRQGVAFGDWRHCRKTRNAGAPSPRPTISPAGGTRDAVRAVGCQFTVRRRDQEPSRHGTHERRRRMGWIRAAGPAGARQLGDRTPADRESSPGAAVAAANLERNRLRRIF